MVIAVIDGQGGGLGAKLVESLCKALPDAQVFAVGANAMATERMIKAGASRAATGENAVCVVCRRADVITGPVGIAVADSMLGEITPTMALAVAQSSARRILLPVGKCETLVVGAGDKTMSDLIAEAVGQIVGQTKACV